MRSSDSSRILTTHAGRLPVPLGLLDVQSELWAGASVTSGDFLPRITDGIASVIRKQAEIGLDCVGDGEFWKNRGFSYYGKRFSGIEARELRADEKEGSHKTTRERDEFSEFYADMDRAGTMFFVPGARPAPPPRERMVATGPIRSIGTEVVARELDVFKKAITLSGAKVEESFVAVLAPGWLDHFIFNEHYRTEEEFIFALADALGEEYRAVVDAGFLLQVDDPGLVDWWDMIKPAISVSEYKKWAGLRVEALNQALRGIPEDRVRYHLCWGSWHGPHTHDLPLRDIVDVLLRVKAQAYSFEAANVRHEHEWRVWQEVKLPEDRILMPGVVSHATNVVEHPQLVADRIIRFADCVGPERVIASTDCGLGGRVHAQLAWAKLAALVEGARIASRSLRC